MPLDANLPVDDRQTPQMPEESGDVGAPKPPRPESSAASQPRTRAPGTGQRSFSQASAGANLRAPAQGGATGQATEAAKGAAVAYAAKTPYGRAAKLFIGTLIDPYILKRWFHNKILGVPIPPFDIKEIIIIWLLRLNIMAQLAMYCFLVFFIYMMLSSTFVTASATVGGYIGIVIGAVSSPFTCGPSFSCIVSSTARAGVAGASAGIQAAQYISQ
ncbi:MAG: hypothetical protein V1821_01190 [bacterium]